MNFYRLSLMILLMALTSVNAQETSETPVVKKKRNARFSILGGPGYAPESGVLLGGSVLATFKINPSDTIQPRSVVPMAFGVMLTNGGGFTLISRPQLFFKHDRYRLEGQYSFKKTIDHYYGVGYQSALNKVRSDSTTEFNSMSFQINPVFLFRLGESEFFLGPMVDFAYDEMTKPAAQIVEDPDYLEYGGDASGYSLRTNGVGLSFSYDTRDVPANAYRGIFLDGKFFFASKALGSDFNYGSYAIDYRQYRSIEKFGPRRVLAWNVSSKYSFGDVPPPRMQKIGTPFDLRGYYNGQFRDQAGHVAVMEYRHMFNSTFSGIGRWWDHFGFAAWGGVGLMGPDPFRIEGVLPNAGLGLRIELQPRMNFRLDIGRGFRSDQTLIYFNMTEAF